MPAYRLTLPSPHAGQLAIKAELPRFGVLACGRRWGKTQFGADYLLPPALEGQPVAWFAPTYKLLLEVWRDFERLLAPVTRRSNATDRRIELVTGGVVEFWTLENEDAGRSRKYKRAFIDEAGLVARLLAAWNEAILPTLADLRGGAVLGGTPKGRNGFFHLFQRGASGDGAWKSWQRPTHDNPFIPADELELLRSTMPERAYAQEILAQFLEDGGGVFRNVRAASTARPLARAESGAHYVGGVDWAREHDFTVLTVMDATTRRQVALDRFTGVEYATQIGRFKAMHERFGVQAWIAEANSMGGPLVEMLQREGLPVRAFTTTNATKAQLVDALALALEQNAITLLDDEVQIAELESYEMERLPSGAMRYSAPEGAHDDCVMSVMLALHGAAAPEVTVRWL